MAYLKKTIWRGLLKTSAVLFLGLLLSGSGANALADEGVDSISKSPLEAGIDQLSGHQNLTEYSLPLSEGMVRVPPGFTLLRGEAARQRLFLTFGTRSPEVEAVLFNADTQTQLVLSYVKSGRVSMEDWSHLDTDHLIRQITQITQKENPQRKKHHLAEWYVRGWAQQPTLHPTGHAVSWVMDLKADGERRLLGTAIKLGRYGYEKLVWSSPHDSRQVSEKWLEQIIATHAFVPGLRYSDRLNSDRSDGISIASLIAVNATGLTQTEAGSTTWLTSMMAMGQKFSFIPILIGFCTLGGFFREWLRINFSNPLKLSDR